MNNEIRSKIDHYDLTFKWLISQLSKRGVVVTKSEMSSIIAGNKTGGKASNVLETSVNILRDYERRFENNDN